MNVGTPRPVLVLYALWAILCARMVVGIVRHESLRDDSLALPMIGFVVLTAIAGGRLYARVARSAS